MPAEFVPAAPEYLRILPEIILAVVATLVLAAEPLAGSGSRRPLGYSAVVGLLAALAASILAQSNPGPAFGGMLVVDTFATFFRVLVTAAGVLVALTSFNYLQRESAETGEYYALLLYSILGQSIMAAAGDLIVMFIGLEISSIASYVLAGFLRRSKLANEAAVKYFLLGSFATGFFLYGIALTYGLTGTTRLAGIERALSGAHSPAGLMFSTAVALMFVGLAFKVSAAPFQVWAPDVYQGAPAPVTAFLAAGPKAAAVALLLRVFDGALGAVSRQWEPVLWVSALLTMVVGNFAALTQNNVKRLLGYSSIAHAGYVLVAVTAHSVVGATAAMFYLAAYVFMNVGAFAVVTYFSRKGERYVEVDDLAGLGGRQPALAAVFTLFLLSLIGVPLTAGFFGKFYIFKAAIESRLVWLAVLGLLNSAVAAYYYLRLIVVMYMREPGESMHDLPPLAPSLRATLWACAAGTLLLGLAPSLVLNLLPK